MNRTLDLRGGGPLLLTLFAGLAATVIALGFLTLEKSGSASVVVSAVTIDVVLVIPVFYYVMVVRGHGLPAITMLPVFRLSLVLAGMMRIDGLWVGNGDQRLTISVSELSLDHGACPPPAETGTSRHVSPSVSGHRSGAAVLRK